MGEFRVVMEVTTNTYGKLVELLREASTSIEQRIPGTVAWEVFGDEATGRVLIVEEFQNEDAADAYEKLMESSGFVERAYDLFTSARVLILNPVTQSIWSEIAARPTSHCLLPISGFRRLDGDNLHAAPAAPGGG